MTEGEKMSRHWKLKSFTFILGILLLGLSGNVRAQEISVFTDNWPPYNFEANGEIVGVSTELIEEALKKTKIPYNLQMFPFKRAFITVQRTPNSMFFTVARTPVREDKFAWIGPIYPRRVLLFKLKNRDDIQINNLEDVMKYRTGVVLGGSVESYFNEHGFPKDSYAVVSNAEQLLKLLFHERVDIIPGDPLDMAYQVKNSEFKNVELEMVHLLTEEGGYYMAANKDTPAEIIAKIQDSLEQLMETGARDRIIKKYVE